MGDPLVSQAVAIGDDDRIRTILAEVCALTRMGFAAVARVTEDRWIACQVLDQIGFGLTPGGELAIQTTICNEIRESGRQVIIDHVAGNMEWRTHHTPALYGFESYAALPLVLPGGAFFGTLCAIDPEPRALSSEDTITALQACADRVAAIVSQRVMGG